jgi:hypothetical protein
MTDPEFLIDHCNHLLSVDGTNGDFTELATRLRAIAEKYRRMEEALRFYADQRNHRLAIGQKRCEIKHRFDVCALEHQDSYDGNGPGARARAALSEGQ